MYSLKAKLKQSTWRSLRSWSWPIPNLDSRIVCTIYQNFLLGMNSNTINVTGIVDSFRFVSMLLPNTHSRPRKHTSIRIVLELLNSVSMCQLFKPFTIPI
eukprot:NODE_221_length_12388_cov_2.350883.p12 type:complete len:100 gc:universal NODE_221_length_12388_cov_2.350883:2026-2325(+)